MKKKNKYFANGIERPPKLLEEIAESFHPSKFSSPGVAGPVHTTSQSLEVWFTTSHVNGCTDPATELQWLVVSTVNLVQMYKI